MASISDIFKQIGQVFVKKPASQQQKPASAAKPGEAGKPKGFDFKLYMQAVQMFGKEFFGKQVPDFFKDPMPRLRNLPNWWGQQKMGEQIAYGGIVMGFTMIIVGVVLVIVV